MIPAKHYITKLIFEDTYIKQLHAGPQLLLAIVRQTFWPINGLYEAKRTVHNCITCFRNKPVKAVQLMGSLPIERISSSRAFATVGIDYAGPFLIRQKNQRGGVTGKAYVAIFVCFSTKAIHIEVVSDLTSASFLGALRRFVSRRGKCLKIYSDNGTNFVGAYNEIQAVQEFFKLHNNTINQFCAEEDITWSFIPPRSPHMGGLWEAGVKSFKHHFLRVTANTTLTFEELSTLAIQIEAILNTRPITPLSEDPNEFELLTPSHFLCGTANIQIPDQNIQNIKEYSLSRWQKVTFKLQHFWSRWSKEYLHTLQYRNKWNRKVDNININDLVLIVDENTHTTTWPTGRVIKVHRGKDGFVRMVDLRTKLGLTSRAIGKICPFPKY